MSTGQAAVSLKERQPALRAGNLSLGRLWLPGPSRLVNTSTGQTAVSLKVRRPSLSAGSLSLDRL